MEEKKVVEKFVTLDTKLLDIAINMPGFNLDSYVDLFLESRFYELCLESHGFYPAPVDERVDWKKDIIDENNLVIQSVMVDSYLLDAILDIDPSFDLDMELNCGLWVDSGLSFDNVFNPRMQSDPLKYRDMIKKKYENLCLGGDM